MNASSSSVNCDRSNFVGFSFFNKATLPLSEAVRDLEQYTADNVTQTYKHKGDFKEA